MKTRLYIIILASGFLGACSGSMMLSTGYDDIYYSPGDEPVYAVIERSATPLDNAYSAMEFADAGTTEEGLNVYQTDTLQADAYYEAGDSSMIVNNYYENSGYDNYGGIPYSARIRRGDFTGTHLHSTTLVPIIVRFMILSLSGYIQDITCSVIGIITETLTIVMVIILIIMILSTRVPTIMDHTGQDTGPLILITLIGEVLVIIVQAFIIEIRAGRMIPI